MRGGYAVQEGLDGGMQPVIAIDKCRRGAGTFVEFAAHELAVFLDNAGKVITVTDNACPHSSGNLSAGEVVDGCVICPLHQWAFDAQSGVCTESAKARVRVYPAEVRGDTVFVDLG